MRSESNVVLKYDRDGHEVEHYEENMLSSSWTRTKQEFAGGRLVGQTIESGYGGVATPRDSVRILYAGERVVEITKEQGNGPQMHVVNFEYDLAGRVTHYEYRLGSNDSLAVRTEIKYTADTVKATTILAEKAVALLVKRLDAKRRVVDLSASHAQSDKLAVWYHASFRYDDKDRVIEQIGDQRDLGKGLDYAPDGLPLPGRVTIAYDDAKLMRTQEFYEQGRIALRAVAQLDRDGMELSVRVFDGEGNEKPVDELVPNSTTGKPERKLGQSAWEVQYDSRGNWTERTLRFTPADGGPKVVLENYERTIAYR